MQIGNLQSLCLTTTCMHLCCLVLTSFEQAHLTHTYAGTSVSPFDHPSQTGLSISSLAGGAACKATLLGR